MNNTERYEYYMSGVLKDTATIELLDWASYWTSAGLDTITDPLQREQTRIAIHQILGDPDPIAEKVARMVISDDAIKEAEPDAVPPEAIHSAVVSIMANRLNWITGIEVNQSDE